MDKDDIINYVMETPGNSNPAVLGSMLKSYSGSSDSALPAVTSEDNGDVLTVVEGAWAKAAPSGGGVINIKWDDNHRTVQTAKELYDASTSGSALLAGPNALPVAVGEYYASDEDEEPAGYELTYSYFNFPEAGHNILTLVVCKFRVEMADAETTGFLYAGDAGTAYQIEITT